MNYEKISNPDLDLLLLSAFLPARRDRVNFSHRENFIELIVPKLISNKLQDDFGENVLLFMGGGVPADPKKVCINYLTFYVFMADIKIFKMAALKTFHENKEYIKL